MLIGSHLMPACQLVDLYAVKYCYLSFNEKALRIGIYIPLFPKFHHNDAIYDTHYIV